MNINTGMYIGIWIFDSLSRHQQKRQNITYTCAIQTVGIYGHLQKCIDMFWFLIMHEAIKRRRFYIFYRCNRLGHDLSRDTLLIKYKPNLPTYRSHQILWILLPLSQTHAFISYTTSYSFQQLFVDLTPRYNTPIY